MTETGAPQKARKRRPPPRVSRVEAIERVTPRLLRVTFVGLDLVGIATPRPAAHIKLFFPPINMVWPPTDPDAPRAPSRTYTPRRVDPVRGLMEVEIVLHGEGLASMWAERAQVGDVMTIGGPGGGYDAPADARRLIIVVDDSALPAAGMILESLPAGCEAQVIAEISSETEERPLSPTVPCAPLWLHRTRSRRTPGALLEAAVEALPGRQDDANWWIACEAAAMRRIRDRVISQFNVDRTRLHTRGYWKFGATNHPDHDYGDD